MSKAGIYQIRNTANGRVYVGQAVDLDKRWIKHLHHLRAGNHHCLPLQNSWNKHGEKTFEFSVLRVCEINKAELTRLEQSYMNELCSHISEGGYNIAPAAGSNIGVKYSAESRAKMSAAQKGRIFSDEAKAKISASLTGKKASPETVEKRRAKPKGKVRTPEQIKNIRQIARKRVETPEYKAFGKSQTLRDWAEEYGINKAMLRNMGLPGVNGHHHKHEVWGMFSPIYGPYEWHQMGAGHRRSASHCEGEKWHNGFALVNIDTKPTARHSTTLP